MKIVARKEDGEIERTILTAMIVSSDFLTEVSNYLDSEYFENDYVRKVSEWVIDYFKNYGKAPFQHIEEIYHSQKHKIKDTERQLVETLLISISEHYKQGDELNVDFLIDKSVIYFKQRELELTVSNINALLSRGKVNEAESLLLDFRRVGRLTSTWENPFSEDSVYKVFEERKEPFLQFKGELGRFLKGFQRGWLIGITAPFKKGKTWLLQEFGILGMFNRRKVVFFSLEMTQNQMNERLYKRLTALGDKETGSILYPTFDCVLNQLNICKYEYREGKGKLINRREDEKPKYSDVKNRYEPCSYCRYKYPKKYEMATWYISIEKDAFDYDNVAKSIRTVNKYHKDQMRVKCYPRFSASISDLKRDLDILEKVDGFIPDIIVVDYADILKADDSQLTGTAKEDDIWMKLAGLAGERHVLVVTATQATKEAMDAPTVTHKHTAKWVGKLAHVNLMLAMSQTPAEKVEGVMRLNYIVHRHEDFGDKCVTLLQEIKTGQVVLDSQM